MSMYRPCKGTPLPPPPSPPLPPQKKQKKTCQLSLQQVNICHHFRQDFCLEFWLGDPLFALAHRTKALPARRVRDLTCLVNLPPLRLVAGLESDTTYTGNEDDVVPTMKRACECSVLLAVLWIQGARKGHTPLLVKRRLCTELSP